MTSFNVRFSPPFFFLSKRSLSLERTNFLRPSCVGPLCVEKTGRVGMKRKSPPFDHLCIFSQASSGIGVAWRVP